MMPFVAAVRLQTGQFKGGKMSEKYTETSEEIIESCELERPVRVLMVVTNADEIGEEKHKTGVWFEEFAVPYLEFLKEGYFVTTASLKGGKAPIDKSSENFIDDIKWKAAKQALEDTIPLESIDYTLYDAIVFPGGHGPMVDIARSELTGEIINYFCEKNRIIAAICHGPAGLLTAEKDGRAFVEGKRLTCFTNEEEKSAKMDKIVPFFLEDALKDRGAIFVKSDAGEINIVEDNNLITAQNFQSAEQFAKAVISHLNAGGQTSCEK